MSQQLHGISSMATRQVLADLAELYERLMVVQVGLEPMGGVEAAKRVRAGELTDIVVLASSVMEKLESEGHIIRGSRADIVRSGMAICIRAGAKRPAIDSGEAVKAAILAAGIVCYSTGPSGDHLLRLLDHWGIKPNLLQAPSGVPVASIVARGEADLGVQQLSELLHVPGVEILGSLPPDIQLTTIFTAGIAATSTQPALAGAVITFLASPEAEAAKRRYGMEPA